MEIQEVIKRPVSSEKSIRAMESENKLVFAVHLKATKAQIKKAMESLFKVKIEKITTHITPQGEKRAYVKFGAETPAIDIATQLGLM
ncbi:50S ribosomal protein L23 [Candidatus Woesearchaeota archaeon]|nr:50S ribosomal protein L23 [Candidatus Woesearchaeota archaeon]